MKQFSSLFDSAKIRKMFPCCISKTHLLLLSCIVCTGIFTSSCALQQIENTALPVPPSVSSTQKTGNIFSTTALTPDGMQWMTYQNNYLGIVFDYPKYVWNSAEEKEIGTTIHDVNVQSPLEQKIFRREYGQLPPYLNQAVFLGIEKTGHEFVLFTDTATNDEEATQAIRKRYGATCVVSFNGQDSNISQVIIQWEKGSNLGTTQCKIPNVAYRILFNKSKGIIAFLFMNQENRFLSRTNLEPNNFPGYDGFIKKSFRFAKVEQATTSSSYSESYSK